MPDLAVFVERLKRRGLVPPRSLMLFVVVGLIGLGVHTALFSLLFHQAALDKRVAWLAALAVATAVTWTLNRRFTFAATGRRSGGEIARYAAVTAVAQGISFGVFMTLGRLLPQLPAQFALVVGAVVATAFSYTGQRFFTFGGYGAGEVETDAAPLTAVPAPDPAA